MAKPNRAKKRVGSLKYFYWEGELYERLHVNRPLNMVLARKVATGEDATILYSDWKRRRGKAFNTKEVSRIINRHPARLYRYINLGRIKAPERTNDNMNLGGSGRYYWSEEDILALHDYLAHYGNGRVRKDGLMMPARNLPTRSEVKARMGRGAILYVQTDDGEFIPTWKEPTF
jgi:hypothetical protein